MNFRQNDGKWPSFSQTIRFAKMYTFWHVLGGMRWTTRDPKTKEKNEGGKT